MRNSYPRIGLHVAEGQMLHLYGDPQPPVYFFLSFFWKVVKSPVGPNVKALVTHLAHPCPGFGKLAVYCHYWLKLLLLRVQFPRFGNRLAVIKHLL